MEDEVYQLTEKGKATVLGVVSAICHGYDLEQVAVLNGLDDANSVKVMLMMVLAQAGIIDEVPYLD